MVGVETGFALQNRIQQWPVKIWTGFTINGDLGRGGRQVMVCRSGITADTSLVKISHVKALCSWKVSSPPALRVGERPPATLRAHQLWHSNSQSPKDRDWGVGMFTVSLRVPSSSSITSSMHMRIGIFIRQLSKSMRE